MWPPDVMHAAVSGRQGVSYAHPCHARTAAEGHDAELSAVGIPRIKLSRL
jgi:hypothetical protein